MLRSVMFLAILAVINRLGISRKTALKGRDTRAQGAALGNRARAVRSPERAKQFVAERSVSPFQG